jgi:hypothetical protein
MRRRVFQHFPPRRVASTGGSCRTAAIRPLGCRQSGTGRAADTFSRPNLDPPLARRAHNPTLMLFALALALGLTLAPTPPTPQAPDFRHVRTADPCLEEILAHAARQSPTFASLLARLEATDVVVYFVFVHELPRQAHGHLHFVTATGGRRYLRVRLPARLARHDLIASIAHELWHAIEIGENREVRCEKSMEALYRKIGDEYGAGMFETKQAIHTGRIVRAEVLAP